MLVGIRKDKMSALSLTKAEYINHTHTSKELISLHRTLTGLNRKQYSSKPLIINCHNRGAQQSIDKPVYYKPTEYRDAIFHSIRKFIKEGILQINYLDTNNTIADLFTKSSDRTDLSELSPQ